MNTIILNLLGYGNLSINNVFHFFYHRLDIQIYPRRILRDAKLFITHHCCYTGVSKWWLFLLLNKPFVSLHAVIWAIKSLIIQQPLKDKAFYHVRSISANRVSLTRLTFHGSFILLWKYCDFRYSYSIICINSFVLAFCLVCLS